MRPGILALFIAVPMWLWPFLFYVLIVTPIQSLREHAEGVAYDTSTASRLGDAALLTIPLIGIYLVQGEYCEPGANKPAFVWAGWYQLGTAVIAIGVGLIWRYIIDPNARPGDAYHHLVVAPLILYLLALFVPIVWASASKTQFHTAAVMAGVWLFCLIYDAGRGRLNQRAWLEKRGIKLWP